MRGMSDQKYRCLLVIEPTVAAVCCSRQTFYYVYGGSVVTLLLYEAYVWASRKLQTDLSVLTKISRVHRE